MKNTLFRLLISLALPAAVSGCTAGPLESLLRVIDDPVVSEPSVVCLQRENRIDVSWEADDGAEEYVLERAADSATLTYSVVYRGTDNSYADDGLADQSRYLYRLSKKRGTRTFGPSEAILGVGSSASIDEHEPNDAESSATDLSYDLVSNLFYYRTYGGQVIQDTDWYAVAVPPRRIANIVITQDGLSGGAIQTYFYFYEKGMVPVTVANNATIPVSNTSYETKRVLFKVYPKPDEFVSDLTLGGGTLVNYTISLYSIIQL